MKKLLIVLCALSLLLAACAPKDYALQWEPGAYVYPDGPEVQEVSEVTDADVVILIYFDAYCTHCQYLLYEMAAMYPALQERGIEIVALEMGGASRSDVRTLTQMLSIRYPVVVNAVPYFDPGYRPYTFIVSHGQVIEEVVGADSVGIANIALNA